MKQKIIFVITAFLVFILFNISFAQTNGSEHKNNKSEIEQLKAELEALKQKQETKLDELEKLVKEIKNKLDKKDQEDELQKLLEEANQLKNVEKKEEKGLGKKFRSGIRQQSGLNPNISVTGDFMGSISSTDASFTNDRNDVVFGSNRWEMRELQLNLVAPLDPFTRGKAFISFGEGSVSIEEGYMDWLNLPLNMNLKVGLFRTEFGAFNRWHDHALPQYDRPKALVNLFSIWSLVGLGASANFMLPPLFFADASSFDFAIVNGGAGFSFADHTLITVGNFLNYYDLNRDSYIEWALSSAVGKNDPAEKYNSVVSSLALTYKWRPVGRSKYKTFEWKSEFLHSYREDPVKDITSIGFYTSLQNKLNSRWWISGRVGYSELPHDNKQNEWDYTACVDFWQSEFVFVRFQYQYSQRNFTNYLNYAGPYPDDHALTFHVAWSMGPHKHSAY